MCSFIDNSIGNLGEMGVEYVRDFFGSVIKSVLSSILLGVALFLLRSAASFISFHSNIVSLVLFGLLFCFVGV